MDLGVVPEERGGAGSMNKEANKSITELAYDAFGAWESAIEEAFGWSMWQWIAKYLPTWRDRGSWTIPGHSGIDVRYWRKIPLDDLPEEFRGMEEGNTDATCVVCGRRDDCDCPELEERYWKAMGEDHV